jgi:hypothetical protein
MKKAARAMELEQRELDRLNITRTEGGMLKVNWHIVDEVRDLGGNLWARNDRVEVSPFGEGKIAFFVNFASAVVVFDTAPHLGLCKVPTLSLTLIRRRTKDEIPCDVQGR